MFVLKYAHRRFCDDYCFAHYAVYSTLTSTVLISALVLSLGGSVLLLARSIWRVGFGAEKRRSIEAFYRVLSVGAASFIAIDLLQESRVHFASNFEFYTDFGCLLLFITMTFCAYHASTHHGSAVTLRRFTSSWLLIFLALMMTGWSYHRIQILSSAVDFIGISEIVPGMVELDDHSLAMTDEGTSIPLYRFAIDDNRFEEYALSSEMRFKIFGNAMIHREDANKMANCHGWVFTDGRFLLKGIDVDRILCENHYELVADPRPSDIVIYRDEMGSILHTALVQGILRDGTVITESKWGIDQRFLHLPAKQPYSQHFEYYRTHRPNHLIRIRDSTFCDDD